MVSKIVEVKDMSSSLVKKGFGVGARVKLVKPIKGFGNYTIPEKFQPHIGQEVLL